MSRLTWCQALQAFVCKGQVWGTHLWSSGVSACGVGAGAAVLTLGQV